MDYNSFKLGQLLLTKLTDTQFTDLCFHYFRPVYNNFTNRQERSDRVRSLIEYAESNQKISYLLQVITQFNSTLDEEIRVITDLHLANPNSLTLSTVSLEINSNSQPDIYRSLLQEGKNICVDRSREIETFVGMLVDSNLRKKTKILGYQLSGGQGKTRLLRRLEHICTVCADRGQRLLYVHEEFQGRTPPPDLFIVTLTKKLISKTHPHLEADIRPLQQLAANIDDVEYTRPAYKRERSTSIKASNLATRFAKCLIDLPRDLIIVLLLDNFHGLQDTGEWFLDVCLPMFKVSDNVIIVIASRSGLDDLKEIEGAILRDSLDPILDPEDCQDMAKLFYSIDLSKVEAEDLIKRTSGDAFKLDVALKAKQYGL